MIQYGVWKKQNVSRLTKSLMVQICLMKTKVVCFYKSYASLSTTELNRQNANDSNSVGKLFKFEKMNSRIRSGTLYIVQLVYCTFIFIFLEFHIYCLFSGRKRSPSKTMEQSDDDERCFLGRTSTFRIPSFGRLENRSKRSGPNFLQNLSSCRICFTEI